MPEPAAPPRVTVSVEAGVADVRLNRPDKLNALDPAMFEALVEASDRVAADQSVRAVVISGLGNGFCAGLDLATFQAGADQAADNGAANPTAGGIERRLEGRITNRFQQVAWAWAELPVPVIAAVHGVALGGGLQIALAADLRIVAPDARLSVLEIRWGLIPDMTGTHFLAQLMRPDVAKELTWTGRMVSGEEAVALGLATRVAADPRAEALALAKDLAGRNPHAIQAGKRLLDRSLGAEPADQFLEESRAMAGLIGSPNQVEAVTAFFEKRQPVFLDTHMTHQQGTLSS